MAGGVVMGNVKFKPIRNIEEEKKLRDQKKIEKKERRKRINENLPNANSVKALREIVQDLVEELEIKEGE